jgi:proline dehydrogenase
MGAMVDFGAVLRRLPTREEVAGSIDQLVLAREAASPFVAGESVDDAVRAVGDTLAAGMGASVLYLSPTDEPDAAGGACVALVEALAAADLSIGTDLAVSPVALGLGGLGDDEVREALAALCSAAGAAGMTVTLTSVAHELVGPLLRLRADLAETFPDLGVTLSANLHRTEADCLVLAQAGARVRLIRREVAAESSGVAFTDGHDIDLAFVRCTRLLMDNGARPVVATHDARLLEIAATLADRGERAPDEYTVQFRRGVTEGRAAELMAAGVPVSVLIPFGPDWAAYLARWIAVRPSALGKAVAAAIGRAPR